MRKNQDSEMRENYDFSRGVRGKYAKRMATERVQLRKFLDELEQVIGPPSKTELAKVRRAWPKRQPKR